MEANGNLPVHCLRDLARELEVPIHWTMTKELGFANLVSVEIMDRPLFLAWFTPYV